MFEAIFSSPHPDAVIHSATITFAISLAMAGLDRIDETNVRSKITRRVRRCFGPTKENIVLYIKSHICDNGAYKLDAGVGAKYLPSIKSLCLLHKIPNDIQDKPAFTGAKHWSWLDRKTYWTINAVLNNDNTQRSDWLPLIATVAGLKFFIISICTMYEILNTPIALLFLASDLIFIGYFCYRVLIMDNISRCGRKIDRDCSNWHSETSGKSVTNVIDANQIGSTA